MIGAVLAAITGRPHHRDEPPQAFAVEIRHGDYSAVVHVLARTPSAALGAAWLQARREGWLIAPLAGRCQLRVIEGGSDA